MKAENWFQLRIVGVTATGEPGFGRAFRYRRAQPGRAISSLLTTVSQSRTRLMSMFTDAAGVDWLDPERGNINDCTVDGVLRRHNAYDGNGNRQKAVSMGLSAELGVNLGCTGPSGDTTANDQDQLCRYGDFEYRYNARGQLEERERVSDGAVTGYTYDGLGRLKNVVTESGLSVHYVHDALGRRIGKVVDGQFDRGWLYADALNPIAQLDENGDVEATFVYGTRVHVPDAMAMADGSVYRFITDHLGSVRLVVNAADGTVAQRIDYDAFGRLLADTNPGFQPFGFAGGLYDTDTGLVRYGARDYDAYAGRWTAKDPLIFEGLQTNLYQYVANDPANLIDPTGEIVWFLFGAGAAIGAAAQLWANFDAFNCGKISAEQYLTSIAAGALTGALASLPSGLLAGVLAGAGGAGINELVNGSIGAKSASLSEFAQSAGLGAVGGAFAAGAAKLGSNVLRPDRVVGQNLPLPARQTYGVPAGVAGTVFGTVAASELDN
jgi:RHS repeat-associated protein